MYDKNPKTDQKYKRPICLTTSALLRTVTTDTDRVHTHRPRSSVVKEPSSIRGGATEEFSPTKSSLPSYHPSHSLKLTDRIALIHRPSTRSLTEYALTDTEESSLTEDNSPTLTNDNDPRHMREAFFPHDGSFQLRVTTSRHRPSYNSVRSPGRLLSQLGRLGRGRT